MEKNHVDKDVKRTVKLSTTSKLSDKKDYFLIVIFKTVDIIIKVFGPYLRALLCLSLTL